MIIVLRPHVSEEELTRVVERVRELGLTPHVSRGQTRTIVGCIGDDPAAPTVTIYNHLDVQPADREGEGWQRDP